MKKIAFLLIAFLSSYSISAQYCHNVNEDEGSGLKISSICSNREEYTPLISGQTPIITVRIAFHIMQDDNSSGNFQNIPSHRTYLNNIANHTNYLLSNLGVLNIGTTPYIQDSRIRIYLEDIYFHPHTSDWANSGSTSNYLYGKYVTNDFDGVMINQEKKDNVQHVFINGDNNDIIGGRVWGIGTQGGIFHTGWFNNYDTYGANSYLGTLTQNFVHEFGHFLGCLHNFQNGPSGPQCDDCTDNDPLNLSCPLEASSNNFMDYFPGGYNSLNPYPGFSQCQLSKMHYFLNGGNTCSRTVLKDYCTIDPTKTIEINGNYIWSSSKKLRGDLIIKSGSTLTIKCKLHIPLNGKIIVEPNARLIIDEGTITNECGNFWQGIEVWGTTSQHQYPLSQPLHQGKLEIKNGGIIENALIGARNWKTNDYSKIGGVIIANDGVFKNNKKAVEFVIYENFSQTNPAVKMNNLSRFTNTDFIIDNDYLDDPTYFQYHITMWSVYGISYSNCHFFNNVSPKSYLANRNRAIYSIDAGFSINAGCSIMVPNGSTCPESNLLKSTFTGFDKTIEATGAGTTKTVIVNQAIFDNNVNGVFFSELDNFSLNRSTIKLGNPSYTIAIPYNYYGVNTTNSTGYQIEENQFSKYSGSGSTFGIAISNSGTENNRVYKNKFTGLSFGQTISGVNRNPSDPLKGFQFLCNEFNGITSRAVNVSSNISTNGIRSYQGEYSPLKSAGNLFLNTPANSFTIHNSTPNPIIYYHNNGFTIPTINTANVSLVATSNSNSCPSSFIMVSGKQALINTSDSLQTVYNDLKYNYLSIIDNGNTSEFIENIKNDWSETAWKLRNELIAKSPYVSEKSLLEALKQNILPNAMILEICLANPDVSKNEKFISQLNEVHTLPGYMLTYIRNNDERTTRTTMEAEMGFILSEKSVIEDELIRLQATAEERTNEDISSVYSIKTNSQKKIDLIELAIETENWQQANSILNESLLDENLKDEHFRFNNYGEYIAFRSNLGSRKLSQLEPTEIEYFQSLALLENKVGGYARNILCFFYDICLEIETEDDSNKMMIIQDKPENTLTELFYNLQVYPNPAENYTSLKWEILDELKDCQYVVYTIEGIEVNRNNILNNQGEVVIDTRNYKNGTYLISIENKGVKKQVTKFVVNNK